MRLRGTWYKLIYLILSSSCHGFELSSSDNLSGCPNQPHPKITIDKFQIKLDDQSHTLNVNIDAAVTTTLTSATATLTLSVFGSDLFSLPINLCSSIGDGTICPIQPGSFNQNYELPIPSQANQAASTLNKIPGADVSARLNIADAEGINLGCVTVGLGDATSAKQPMIQMGTLGITGLNGALALLSGLLGMTIGMNPVPSGSYSRPGPSPSFFDMVTTFQFISMTGQLNLDYPTVLRDFTTNFGWSMGMVSIPPVKYLVKSLNSISTGTSSSGELQRRDVTSKFLPSDASSYSELSGVASYARKLNIPIQDYFFNVLVLIVLLMLVITVLVLLLRVILELLSKVKPNLFHNLRNYYANYYLGNLLRAFALGYSIITTAALFQLTIPGNLPAKVVAGIVLGLFCIFLMGLVSYLMIRTGPTKLYSEPKFHYRYGALYSDYRPPAYTFFLVVILSSLARSVAVGALGHHIWAQLGVLVLTELISFLTIFFMKPYATSLGNHLMIFIGVLRVANTGLLFFFIQSLFLPKLARTILSIAIVVLQAITLLAFTLMTLWGLSVTLLRLFKSDRNHHQSHHTTVSPFLPHSTQSHHLKNLSTDSRQPLYPNSHSHSSSQSPPTTWGSNRHHNKQEDHYRGSSHYHHHLDRTTSPTPSDYSLLPPPTYPPPPHRVASPLSTTPYHHHSPSPSSDSHTSHHHHHRPDHHRPTPSLTYRPPPFSLLTKSNSSSSLSRHNPFPPPPSHPPPSSSSSNS